MRIYSFGFRITVWAVLALFLWSYGPLFQVPVAWAATPAQVKTTQARSEKLKPASAAEQFETALEGLRERIGKTGEKAARAEDITEEIGHQNR